MSPCYVACMDRPRQQTFGDAQASLRGYQSGVSSVSRRVMGAAFAVHIGHTVGRVVCTFVYLITYTHKNRRAAVQLCAHIQINPTYGCPGCVLAHGLCYRVYSLCISRSGESISSTLPPFHAFRCMQLHCARLRACTTHVHIDRNWLQMHTTWLHS